MDSNELIETILSNFRKGTMIVWCGAGISRPSGLPGADDLVKELLAYTRLTTDEQKQIAEIIPRRLPFEKMMEVMLESIGLFLDEVRGF